MRKLLGVIVLIFAFASCSNDKNSQQVADNSKSKKIKLDTSNNGFEMLSDTVISSMSLDMIPNKPPIFKHFDKKEFLDTLISSVLSGKIAAYDFFDFTPLSVKEIKENLGMVSDTIDVVNPETGDTIQKVTNGDFEMSNIREVVFIEKWYWDKSKDFLHKQIIAYGPVIYVVMDDSTSGYPVLKRVPFVVMNK